jgi:hypothetical protein
MKAATVLAVLLRLALAFLALTGWYLVVKGYVETQWLQWALLQMGAPVIILGWLYVRARP